MTRWLPIAFLAFATGACQSTPELQSHDAQPVPVIVSPVVSQRVPRSFEAGGAVRARVTAMLASRITASVLAVHAKAGDRVHAGQSLVTLDARELEARHARALADVTALEQSRAAALADLAGADAALSLARASHARMAMLHARESATPQELDEAVSALRVAEARVDAANAQATAATASLDAARQTEKAEATGASYAELTAPFDGIVSERLVDPGALALPGVPLLRIDTVDRFQLETLIDESRAASLDSRAPVEVLVGPDDGTWNDSVTGTVAEIARALDAGSHTFRVKIDLPARATLRAGLFGRARFTTGTENVLTISPAAIVAQGQLSTVYVVSSDNRAYLRIIDTGMRSDEWVEVLSGVAAAERVIVSPAGIRDGMPVHVAEREAAR